MSDVEEAVKIIEGFIRAIGVMPICWDEFVGENLTDRTRAFITKHDPDSVYALRDEFEEEEE